ncbi:hypothetical protein CPA50_02110 [Marinobacter sp. ANT_B65]|nr:hypothetical protein CPA50_02110 [Marinobacter sp. ANT_B65]
MMPVRLWDQNGQQVWQGNADAWGNCQPETLNNAIHQPLRLPGQFEDELTGIVQNRFRDYDPATGRYLTPDPYGIKGGLNSYRYTPNPVDYVDPLGLDFEPCVTASNVNKADAAPVSENVPAAQETAAEEGFGAFVLGGAREFLHDTLVSAHSYMTGLTPEEIGDPMGLSPNGGAQAAGSQAYKDNALAINLATAFIPGRQQKVARDIGDKLIVAQRVAELDLEGHAVVRHGGPSRVTDLQLEDRAVRGIDPASGTTFDAFNSARDGSPKLHKVGRNATAFTSDDALVHADDVARSSRQFEENIATARANGDMFVDPVELPLTDVFGDNYKSNVRGVTRLGSKKNPTGHVDTDFTGGSVKAIYRLDQNGSVNLHTLYPNPKP